MGFSFSRFLVLVFVRGLVSFLAVCETYVTPLTFSFIGLFRYYCTLSIILSLLFVLRVVSL